MVLLTYYCLAIIIASVVGGLVPAWLKLTHRWMECAVSFVAGVMLGVAMLHLLPHALEAAAASNGSASVDAYTATVLWVLGGFLAMFFIERFFCFHHHGVPEEPAPGEATDGECTAPCCDHSHDLSWSGAALGLSLHSVLAGVALAASVQHGGPPGAIAGFGTFLAILLHKPFDSMTIAMLLARGGYSRSWQAVVNAVFAMAIPAGALLALAGGLSSYGAGPSPAVGFALAFSAGVFLCISMSDLLPELQFHDHDRVKLSVALLLGLAVAWAACRMETHQHGNDNPADAAQSPTLSFR